VDRVGAVDGRDFPPDLAITNLLGFLFSLANFACLATREILCCLGDPEAAGTVVVGLTLPGPGLVSGGEALAAGVVVINSPAAVFLAGGFGLVGAVMVVSALVILGTVVFTIEEGFVRVVLTVLANVVGLF